MKKIIERTNNLIFKFSWSFKNYQSAFTLDYEMKKYRQKDLVWLIRDSIPFFALTHEEFLEYVKRWEVSEINKNAFCRISDANKNVKWDYWEVLLFLILQIFYKSEKFVTKVRLKSSSSMQVHWFDCAHFTIENNKPILWLWEAKFYKNIQGAISSAYSSIKEHINWDTLKEEIIILSSNIEINKSFSEKKFELLKDYLNAWKSIDALNIKIPILLTYESSKLKEFDSHKSKDFIESYKQEFTDIFTKLNNKDWNSFSSNNITFEFILFPFDSIDTLKNDLDMMEKAFRY